MSLSFPDLLVISMGELYMLQNHSSSFTWTIQLMEVKRDEEKSDIDDKIKKVKDVF